MKILLCTQERLLKLPLTVDGICREKEIESSLLFPGVSSSMSSTGRNTFGFPTSFWTLAYGEERAEVAIR